MSILQAVPKAWRVYRMIRFDGKNIAQNIAFVRAKLRLESTGIDLRLPLFRRVFA